MSQIQSDTFGFRNQKKSSSAASAPSETQEGKSKEKVDKKMKKANARIQAQERKVNLKPIELLQF